MTTKKGFTLIELLVVIAIIGLLSSVVLASLNSARAKAANAAVKSNLKSLQSQAAIFYESNGHYGTPNSSFLSGACASTVVGSMFIDPIIQNIAVAAVNAGAGGGMCNSGNGNPATVWAVLVPLKAAEGGSYWCVDSTGASKSMTPNQSAPLSC